MAAGLLAILMATGGHWFVLQTVAWGRMFVDFAQHDSLGTALVKTFDGQHPCRMCLQIRQGQQKEQQQGGRLPALKPEKLPELFCDARPVKVPLADVNPVAAPIFTEVPPTDFVESPPKPPPRPSAAAR